MWIVPLLISQCRGFTANAGKDDNKVVEDHGEGAGTRVMRDLKDGSLFYKQLAL